MRTSTMASIPWRCRFAGIVTEAGQNPSRGVRDYNQERRCSASGTRGGRFLTFATPVIYSDDTLWPRILAVLCMREDSRQISETVERFLDSTLESVDSAEDLAVGVAQRAGFDEDDRVKIGMAVRESMVNAVVHGNRYNSDRKSTR